MIVDENRKRHLYLTDGKNVTFIPQGWCDEWSVAAGFAGGLDWIEGGVPSPEIYCYAPTYIIPNSEVETLFVKVSELETLREVSEEEAKQIHPELFQYLDKIDRGE